MIEGLRRAGADVVECHVPLWTGPEDRVQAASGGWVNPRFIGRVFKAYLELLRRHRSVGDYHIMVVGYPGQFDVYLARLLTWFRRRPLVWDVFMSIYLIALERGLDKRSALTVWAIRQIERFACRLPDRLILDTLEYVEWFRAMHDVKAERFLLVPTGADDRKYYPVEPKGSEPIFRVVYYGTFILNHGISYVVEAARLLQNEPDIYFEFIGAGPERPRIEALVRHYGLTNVRFIEWMESTNLCAYLAQADVCLGVFGTTEQSLRTVQNKIYEGLAMRKAVISGDSSAVRRAFTHGQHIYLCPRGDPVALADSIRALRRDSDLRARLARQGHARFLEQFSLQANGRLFRDHLEGVASQHARIRV